VPDAVLNKPGALDASERKQIERHSEYGWAILRVLPGFTAAALFILHHERIDGKGTLPASMETKSRWALASFQ
jgi:HD-GYP domain-containing protein (c-di-GMP phosphodiesterase class II)